VRTHVLEVAGKGGRVIFLTWKQLGLESKKGICGLPWEALKIFEKLITEKMRYVSVRFACAHEVEERYCRVDDCPRPTRPTGMVFEISLGTVYYEK
jgi:hypothetical protein